MTSFRCSACGRDLADETAFCPYCGADRRLPPPVPAAAASTPEPRIEPTPADETAQSTVAPAAPAAAAPEPMLTATPATPTAAPSQPSPPSPRVRRRAGCATPLLVALLAVLIGVSWCTLQRRGAHRAPAVAGAVASEPVRVSRRWRTVRLPGDAPASARFAVSSDTALRVRAAGRLYTVRPGRPLQLPEDVGESLDLRVADYVSAQDAARAKVALATLRDG